jgi:hypothetical protein
MTSKTMWKLFWVGIMLVCIVATKVALHNKIAIDHGDVIIIE